MTESQQPPERVEYDTHAEKHPPGHPAHRPAHVAVWLGALLTAVILFSAGLGINEAWQQRTLRERNAARLTGGDPGRGKELLRPYGCAQCHTIAGVPGASGLVGPPLTGIASRVYVAGVLTNTPENLVRWILDPKGIDPLTAMPDVGVSESQARDIAAYLYTLR